ncbi:E2AK2 kinase, partial [Rhinopomastus cyanomelas]|nr:E2AK2 kinase [Rhinopomastus cyanomelas]
FTVKLKMDDVGYGTGTGRSKKEAKEEAARKTLEIINKDRKTLEMTDNNQVSPVTVQPVSASDYVSILNVYSQKTSQKVDYPEWNRTGSPHAPTFSCSCSINGSLYGSGTGASQGAAKQAAAKEAVEKLIERGFLTVHQYQFVSLPTNCSKTCGFVLKHSVLSYCSSVVICFCTVDPVYILGSTHKIGDPTKLLFSHGKNADVIHSCKCFTSNFDNARSKEEEKKVSHLIKHFSDLDTSTSEEKESPYTVNKRFLEDFKNLEPIGEGGFGNVFKATAKLDKRTYAVKRVQFREKVEREVEQLARLEHENIIRYYGSWEGNDYVTYPDSRQKSDNKIKCLFIQMELCERGTLENWIEKNREAQKYHEMAQNKFLQILRGVKYIHSKGLIHRDLKPQNIFISCEDKIKIGDFGLVTSVQYVTRTENRGTKSYMAPEQEADNYGNEVDIYALGLIWFEILAACSGHEKSKIWPRTRAGELPEYITARFPVETPIIKKMLSRDPSGRYSASKILLLLKPVDKENSLRTHTH